MAIWLRSWSQTMSSSSSTLAGSTSSAGSVPKSMAKTKTMVTETSLIKVSVKLSLGPSLGPSPGPSDAVPSDTNLGSADAATSNYKMNGLQAYNLICARALGKRGSDATDPAAPYHLPLMREIYTTDSSITLTLPSTAISDLLLALATLQPDEYKDIAPPTLTVKLECVAASSLTLLLFHLRATLTRDQDRKGGAINACGQVEDIYPINIDPLTGHFAGTKRRLEALFPPLTGRGSHAGYTKRLFPLSPNLQLMENQLLYLEHVRSRKVQGKGYKQNHGRDINAMEPGVGKTIPCILNQIIDLEWKQWRDTTPPTPPTPKSDGQLRRERRCDRSGRSGRSAKKMLDNLTVAEGSIIPRWLEDAEKVSPAYAETIWLCTSGEMLEAGPRGTYGLDELSGLTPPSSLGVQTGWHVLDSFRTLRSLHPSILSRTCGSSRTWSLTSRIYSRNMR